MSSDDIQFSGISPRPILLDEQDEEEEEPPSPSIIFSVLVAEIAAPITTPRNCSKLVQR